MSGPPDSTGSSFQLGFAPSCVRLLHSRDRYCHSRTRVGEETPWRLGRQISTRREVCRLHGLMWSRSGRRLREGHGRAVTVWLASGDDLGFSEGENAGSGKGNGVDRSVNTIEPKKPERPEKEIFQGPESVMGLAVAGVSVVVDVLKTMINVFTGPPSSSAMLAQRIRMLEREAKTLQEEKIDLEKAVHEVRTSAVVKELSTMKALEAEADSAATASREKEVEKKLVDLESILQKTSLAKSQVEDQLRTLTQAVDDRTCLLDEANKRKERAEEEIRSMQSQLVAKEKELARAQSEAYTLRPLVEEHEGLQKEIDQRSNELDAAQDEIERLGGRIEKLDLERQQLAAKVTSVEDERVRERASYETELDQLTSKAAEGDRMARDLKSKLVLLEEKKSKVSSSLQSALDELLRVRGQLSEEKDRSTSFEAEMQKISAQSFQHVEDLQAQVVALERALTAKVEETAATVSALESQLQDVKSEIEVQTETERALQLQMKKTFDEQMAAVKSSLVAEKECALSLQKDALEEQLASMKSSLLAEKESELNAQRVAFEDRVASLKNSLLAEKESELKLQEDALDEQVASIRTSLVAEKESELKLQKDALEERITSMKSSAFAEKEFELKLQRDAYEDRIASIQSSLLVEKETELKEQEGDLAAAFERRVDSIQRHASGVVASLETTLKEKGAELAQKSRTLAQLEGQLEDMRGELARNQSNFRAERDRLVEDNETKILSVENVLSQREIELEKKSRMVLIMERQLQDSLETNDRALDRATSETTRLEKGMEDAEEEIATLQQDLARTRGIAEQSKKKQHEAEARLEDVVIELRRLQHEHRGGEELEERYVSLLQELDTSRLAHEDELHGLVAQFAKKTETLEEEIAKTQKEREELKTRLAKQMGKSAPLRQDSKDVAAGTEMSQEVQKMKMTIAELRKELQHSESRLSGVEDDWMNASRLLKKIRFELSMAKEVLTDHGLEEHTGVMSDLLSEPCNLYDEKKTQQRGRTKVGRGGVKAPKEGRGTTRRRRAKKESTTDVEGMIGDVDSKEGSNAAEVVTLRTEEIAAGLSKAEAGLLAELQDGALSTLDPRTEQLISWSVNAPQVDESLALERDAGTLSQAVAEKSNVEMTTKSTAKMPIETKKKTPERDRRPRSKARARKTDELETKKWGKEEEAVLDAALCETVAAENVGSEDLGKGEEESRSNVATSGATSIPSTSTAEEPVTDLLVTSDRSKKTVGRDRKKATTMRKTGSTKAKRKKPEKAESLEEPSNT